MVKHRVKVKHIFIISMKISMHIKKASRSGAGVRVEGESIFFMIKNILLGCLLTSTYYYPIWLEYHTYPWSEILKFLYHSIFEWDIRCPKMITSDICGDVETDLGSGTYCENRCRVVFLNDYSHCARFLRPFRNTSCVSTQCQTINQTAGGPDSRLVNKSENRHRRVTQRTLLQRQQFNCLQHNNSVNNLCVRIISLMSSRKKGMSLRLFHVLTHVTSSWGDVSGT